MITELKAEQFRGFDQLELTGLKRVNLIVGQNNAGKTSLLEALFLLCQPSRAAELPGVFRAKQGRDDLRYFRWLPKDGSVNSSLSFKARGADTDVFITSAPNSSDPVHGKWPAVYAVGNLRISEEIRGIHHADPA